MAETKNNDERFPEVKPTKPGNDTAYIAPIIGKLGYDTRRPWLFGLGTSPNNGVDFHVFLSFDGLNFDDNDIDKIWNGGTADKVKKEVDSATAEIPAAVSAANSAVSAAESAVAASKVNSDAIAAQSEAISEAKAAMDSATAEIQQTAANAASDAAKIRADVAQVQNEVDTAKAANSASVEALKSDVGAAKQDLADVHDSLTKAQTAAEESQKAIDKSIDQINSDIEQDRKDIASAQQANADTAKQLDTYSKQAQDQGKTIKSIQDKQDGFTATLADVQGNVTQVSDKVDGLSASLKDAQDNVASVKAQADQLSATLTDHSKDIANLTATAKELNSTLEDASGRLSKVEQTASEQSTTLSDVQGDLTQVKQTADGLVTTLKDAQGNIDQVKQTAKGTAEQLSNAQGDITALQKDVDGIKLTIADHDKNIHTLQADSKSLQDDMEDAKGNISTLQKTSTSITSELKDHAGRISKTEQTAATLTNEFADQQGHLNRVEQTAQGTEQTVANQQGQINTIKTDASGIHETLTGQGNQIASINVTLNGLSSKYEGVSGDLGKLSDKVTTNSTQITQNKKEIDLKADQSTVNNLTGEVSQNKAQLKLQAGQISSKVSSTDFKTLNDKVGNLQAGSRNLVTDGDASAYGATAWENTAFRTHPYYYNSTKNMFVIDTTSKTEVTAGCPNWFPVKAGHQYTLYFNGFMSWNVSSYDVWLLGKKADDQGSWSDSYQIINAERLSQNNNCIIDKTFTVPSNWDNYVAFIRFDNNGSTDGTSAVFFFNEVSVKEGNINTGYSPALEDSITLIKKNSTAIDQTNQKISLKADQTEVDKVKQTASQNSSRLNVMAGEISSKVTSTDVNNIVDGKGYVTTSTVQSLITQKAGTINESITNLDAKYNAKDGVNLVRASGFHNVTLDDLKNSGWTLYDKAWINKNGGSNKQGSIVIDATSITTGVEDIVQTIPLEPDTDYTLSFHLLYESVASGNSFNAWSYIVEEDSSGKAVSPYVDNNHPMFNSDDRKLNTRTFHTSKNTHQGTLYLRAMAGTKIELEEVKLERGTVATPWTPAPSDNASVTQIQSITASIDGLQSNVTNYQNNTSSKYTQLSNLMQSKVGTADFEQLKRSVDMQTLDSADINNMKTSGHYFVHSLTGNPVGGCVYVDVTGNGNDRIRQDVYQDSGLKHKYRRWFGTYWTGWEEGATYTEITQLQDAINLRVQKGELLSQINLTAGNTLIQTGKLYLDSSSVVFSGRAFIPSAAISELDADKLTFYGNGSKASIGAGIAQYDQDAIESTINLQYQGGFEIHSSNQLGSILTMHDNTVRLAVKSNGMANPNSPTDQYSGFYASTSYSLMNSYLKDGTTSGISIGSTDSGANKDYRIHVYDGSNASNNLSKGISISTSSRFDVYAGNSQLFLGPDKAELRGNDHATVHGNDHTFIEGGNQQIYMHNGEVNIGNPNDTGNANGVHFQVFGWASFNGYVEGMGWTTKSTLSSKTRIEKLDTEDALNKIMSTDLETYQYKTEVAGGMTKRHAGPIIDDVHDVAQYSTPDEFINERRTGRSDADVIGYLMGAVQELKKQLDKVKEKINYE